MIYQKKFKIVLFNILLFSVLPFICSAAELFFNPSFKEVAVREEFKVNFLLNTEKQNINAVEGVLFFPQNLLELKKVSDAGSITTLWVEKPIFSEKEMGIKFSGLIPGGYKGQNGLIFSMSFLLKTKGEGVITSAGSKALLNDGQGTLANIRTFNFEFISKDSEDSFSPQVYSSDDRDVALPEMFYPQIAQDENLFGGKWFLVFNTQDKGSGIDYYQIQESKNKTANNGEWEIVESPYLLKDQTLKSYIFVRAVDLAGNQRIVSITSSNPPNWLKNLIFSAVIIGIIALIGFASSARKRYFNKK